MKTQTATLTTAEIVEPWYIDAKTSRGRVIRFQSAIRKEAKRMKTYLTVWFSSEGAEPSVVAEKLLSMGFKPVKGHYDHVYDWKREAALEDVLQLLNNVHSTLKGLNVLYKIETI